MTVRTDVFTTDIPARLDRLPWSRFHWLILAALGVTWILDGLEVTIVGSLSGALQSKAGLGLSATEIGLAASLYIAGAVGGALLFGQLADQYGRRRLFLITVGVYLIATIATGFSWNFASFAFFRALTGAGIGGEYSAINSAIQEFTPARLRGRVDLLVNGSYWIGAALGAMGSLVVLDPALVPAAYGWRLAFIIGGALAGLVMFLRRFVPESPRWLLIHGRTAEAEAVMVDIENHLALHRRDISAAAQIRLLPRGGARLGDLVRSLFTHYPARTFLGLTLMATQAFCYNAIFFTYALVLGEFFGIPAERVGLYLIPFAAGNFLGPLVLGRWFDTIGRRPMIASTYAISGVLLLASAWLFAAGKLDATTMTIAWSVVFFFASAAASSAYLTVSESFPLEVRALAIAVFYALGTAIGGVAGPWLFGLLIGTGDPSKIAGGYAFGATLMLAAAVIELWLGVAAERRSLEEVAAPLSSAS